MLDDIKRITPQIWKTRRQEVMDFIKEDMEEIDTNSQAGEEIQMQSVNLSKLFRNASMDPNATLKEQAYLWVALEGRHSWPKYSGCADLAYCILSLMGFRDNRILNRDDDNSDGIITPDETASLWAIGLNVSKLLFGAQMLNKELGSEIYVKSRPDLNFRPNPGDIVIIGEYGLEHVLIANEWDGNTLISTDGGQVSSFDGIQCIKERQREMIIENGRPYLVAKNASGPVASGLSKRFIVGWIDIAAISPKFTAKGFKAK